MSLLETPRLILRTVTPDDIDQVALTWNLYGEPISRAEAEKEIAWMMANHRENGLGKIVHLCLALIYRETRQFIGWCGLDHRDPARPNPVLFYLLKERFWGKGLATEAARALLEYAFNELRLARIDSACAFENTASRRVMEKIPMRYLGLNEEGGHSFTLTREEFLNKKETA